MGPTKEERGPTEEERFGICEWFDLISI